jgi:hypothetical protein
VFDGVDDGDVIYVNACATRAAETWLDGLSAHSAADHEQRLYAQ